MIHAWSAGQGCVGVLCEEALTHQVAAEIGEPDDKAGLRIQRPRGHAERGSGGPLVRVDVVAHTSNDDATVVDEVGESVADSGGETREQVRAAGRQPVGVLVEELFGETA
jgi:hypothetical protein